MQSKVPGAIRIALFLMAGCLPLLGLSRLACAQHYPLLLIDDIRKELRTAPRKNGPATTLIASLTSTWKTLCMAPGPGDDTAFAVFAAGFSHQVMAVGPGTMRTLATYPNANLAAGLIADMDMDDGGDLRFLWRGYSRGVGWFGGIWSAPIGGSTLTTVITWPYAVSPTDFVEDPATGDWLMANQGFLMRSTRKGIVTSIARLSSSSLTRFGDIEVDPVSGDALVAFDHHVVRVAPGGQLTTLTMPFGRLDDISIDRSTGGYLVCGTKSVASSVFRGVYGGHDLTTWILFSAEETVQSGYEAVETSYARAFTPLSAPARGRPYWLFLRSPYEPGKQYRCALSLAFRPGITTAIGVIPLAPDGLFFLSMLDPPFLTGFGGSLDKHGSTTLTVNIPPLAEIQGLRVHLAGVVYDQTGLLSIHGPHSFSVR